MTDPCDQNCRSTDRFFRSGTFTYTCPYPLPLPLFFNLSNYNLTIVYQGGTDYIAQVTKGSGETVNVVMFSIESGAFVEPIPLSDFAISIGPDTRTLIISTKDNKTFAAGVTWRIGFETLTFTSCLLVVPGYNACDSVERIILNANAQMQFVCVFLPTPGRYNLVDYTLYLQYENGVYYAAVDFVDPRERVRVAQFRYNNTDGFTDVSSLNPSFGAETVGNVFSLQFFGGPVWKLRGDNAFFYPILLTPRPSLGGIPLPQPPAIPPGCPTLFGELFLTADGKQLCQTNFNVNFYNNCFTSQRRDYVFYCTDILRVVRGQGCTLQEKAENLEAMGLAVTTAGLATYGMLRLMLSFLLFGCFDVNLLRRRFYEKFLNKLGGSGFCAYKELFLNSPYWMYFRK